MPVDTKDDGLATRAARRAEAARRPDSEAGAAGERSAPVLSLRERFALLRAGHPLPAPTGQQADAAFFDELSGL